MKKINSIQVGDKVRVDWFVKPNAWTRMAIYEVEEITNLLGFEMVKFKGYCLMHERTNLLLYTID